MKSVVVIASVVLSLVGGGAGTAVAGEPLRPTVLAPNPFAMTPPPAALAPQPASPVPVRPPHNRHPAPVVTYPCCASGYWAYQWVPAAYTYVWVPGYVTVDGTLVGGGYQPQVVTGGYYQPVWVGY